MRSMGWKAFQKAAKLSPVEQLDTRLSSLQLFFVSDRGAAAASRTLPVVWVPLFEQTFVLISV